MVGLSRSPPHCTSSSRSLMVKVLWELAVRVGFSSLTCPMTPSIPSWFINLTWQFFWSDSSISCSSMVVWMCFWLLWGINLLEEAVFAVSEAGCSCIKSTCSSSSSSACEACWAFCSHRRGPRWSPVLLRPTWEEVVRVAVYVWCCASSPLGACLLSLQSWYIEGLPSVCSETWCSSLCIFRQCQGFQGYLLMGQFEHVSPEWTWIVPDSPWWGGWWERLVRSVKTALRKSVGVNSLTHTELLTVLVEIEACINSRPLTFVGDDMEAREPLTPAHFLLGRSGGFYSWASEETSPDPESLGLRWQLCQSVLQQFWSKWSTEYIRNLPQVAGSVKGGQVQVGSLVLVQGETRHSLSWPIGNWCGETSISWS